MGRYLGKVMVAGPNPAEGSNLSHILFFLVLDDGSDALTHHLLVGFAGGCFLVSVSVLGCWLVVADSSSC